VDRAAGPELFRRSCGCGELGETDADSGREVVLTGWVHRRRDLGGLVFVDLRDGTGTVQLVFDPRDNSRSHAVASQLRLESVIGVRGIVRRREAPNPAHPTGQIEVRALDLVVHNMASSVPVPVDDATEANEEARLKYRYVDLRRPRLQRALRLRHRLASTCRRLLDEMGFVELETPILTRSTPEGARDYLVPSRIHPGRFYALPQSPQLFKQLLMIAGFERYYQFARCFRDEDLRADRQPEFTQLDLEMSFALPEMVYEVVESLLAAMFREIGVDCRPPFPRLTYDEAMERYGTDRPDLRFGLELKDAGLDRGDTGFRLFDEPLGRGGAVRGIAVPGGGRASRSTLDTWTSWAKEGGAAGLVWIKLEPEGRPTSPVLRLLGEELSNRLARAVGAEPGDVALLVAGDRAQVNRALGSLRVRIAASEKLVPAGRFEPLWVEGFPLFEWDEADRRWVSCHHPFAAPRWEEIGRLESDPGSVRAQAYDLVLNGTEIAGGSIRIHRRDLQERVFRVLGLSAEEAEEKFGFLLRALESGAPPHGGIALGFDRIAAMLGGCETIRDVIPFPKTTSATCLMTDAPARVDERQLDELGLRLRGRGEDGRAEEESGPNPGR